MRPEPLVGERKEGETDRAVQACNDYLRMGSGRSTEKLHKKYTECTQEKPPSTNYRVLREWSRNFDWVERASLYDALADASKTDEVNRLRTEGLAADYERIRKLTELFGLLWSEIETNGLWYTDTKISSKGDTVDVEVFNNGLITQVRGVLDDLAKEAGGRKQKTELTGKDGKPIEVEQRSKPDLSKLSVDELLQLREIMSKADATTEP